MTPQLCLPRFPSAPSRRGSVRWRASLAVCILAAGLLLASSAHAKVFTKSYFSNSNVSSVTGPVGTHTFSIPNPLPLVRIDWHVNGVKKETDLTGILATPPKYTQAFQQTYDNQNVYDIAAKIYTRPGVGATWVLDRTLQWELRAGKPDLDIVLISFFYPGKELLLRSGEVVEPTASLSNRGGEKATAGLLANQDFAVYLDDGATPISIIQYDDTSSFLSANAIEFPEMSFTELGAHTLTFVADASNAIDEVDETNNTFEVELTIVGDDWLQIPFVAGHLEADALSMLSDAGFADVIVETQYHPTIEAGNVISQTPQHWTWAPPNETITIHVSLGPACDLDVKKPRKNSILELGSIATIRWTYDEWCCETVTIELYQGHHLIRTIKGATANDGKLRWKIAPSKYAPGEDYKIRVHCNDEQGDLGSAFSIVAP